jgi:hypothetical protein
MVLTQDEKLGLGFVNTTTIGTTTTNRTTKMPTEIQMGCLYHGVVRRSGFVRSGDLVSICYQNVDPGKLFHQRQMKLLQPKQKQLLSEYTSTKVCFTSTSLTSNFLINESI